MIELALVTVVAVQDAEPCSPRLLPMTTTRLPVFGPDGQVTGMLQIVSEASTETRELVVYYITPSQSNVVGPFTMEGDAQITNKTPQTRNVKYRQSVKIDEGMVPIFPLGSDLCWEPEKRRIVRDYVFPVGGNETLTQSIDWAVTLRKENQIADINSDGWVDAQDQGILMGDWGTNNPQSDLNFDGTVNGTDLGILFSQWSESSDDEES
tara:strand:+ start:118 stop:744 length:627 start_codon:yes stop_codon:yes gene_type:complete